LSKAESFKVEKADSINLLATIKTALDPNNILNPGKLMQAPDNWVTASNLRYSVNS
jgi:glycolate oxidase